MSALSSSDKVPPDLNLFAGAGGLAIGLCEAGFGPFSLYEKDADACATLRHNVASDRPTLAGSVVEGDLTTVDWLDLPMPVRLLAGGVPCQPFSQAGNHGGHEDLRNLFPDFLNAVRRLKPMGILVENVSGLSRDTHSEYFDYVRIQLEFPALAPKPNEDWVEHKSRLEHLRESPGYHPTYDVYWQVVNAADYGTPQKRKRVFVVAVRSGLGTYRFPEKTHSAVSLRREQSTGDYWKRHGVMQKNRPSLKKDDESQLILQPWVTTRDALVDVGEPAVTEALARFNHWTILGARSYPGHTGSDPDWPSKAIKAGTHGVSGGENTILEDEETIRYYTLREMAIIQGFPDRYLFKGARSSIIRQIGNAVPPNLTKAIALPLARIFGATP